MVRVAWAERQEDGEVLGLPDPETALFPGGPNPWHSPGLLNCLVLEVDVEISSCSWFSWEAKGMVP